MNLEIVNGISALSHVGRVSGLPAHASSGGILLSAAEPPETSGQEVRPTIAATPCGCVRLCDKHNDSIEDGHFLTWPKPDDRWVNLPASRHNQSGTLSFADGHVEQWKWGWPKGFAKKQSYWKRAENEADLADLRRLQESVIPLEGEYTPQK